MISYRKLDCVLTNSHWLESFPFSAVRFLHPGRSDHCPAVVSLGEERRHRCAPFKFFNFYVDQFQLAFKLKLIKKELKKINRRPLADVSIAVKSAKGALDNCQELLATSPSNSLLADLEQLY